MYLCLIYIYIHIITYNIIYIYKLKISKGIGRDIGKAQIQSQSAKTLLLAHGPTII